jgi:alginate O-acetyltransferase complex protein AlgI
VFFRSPTFGGALRMLSGMAGCNGVVLPAGFAFLLAPEQGILTRFGISFTGGSGTQLIKTYLWVSVLMGIAVLFPNSQQFLARAEPVLDVEGGSHEHGKSQRGIRLRWSPSPLWAMAIAAVSFVAIISITRVSEFLYWQF